MAKRESTFLSMALALFTITFVAAAALGFVYDFTKDAIESSKVKAQQEAIKAILPEFDKIGEPFKVAVESSEDSVEIFPAFRDGEKVGTAIKTYTNKGFSGYISIMAGIDNSGNFTGYEVLEHSETPGLGAKMDQWFSNMEKPSQTIIGKNPESCKFIVKKDGGDIDAITASTITSRAFLDAMVRAYDAYTGNEDQNSVFSGK
jgi:Na+-translocating ferredoxin:NAD+ oxidoreductase subunit G